MSSDLAPGRPRILDIDALRGFALLGILIVNITFAASGYPIHVADDPQYSSGVDHAVHWVSSVFVDMKFYLLFSFLFGYSFQLQMEAAQRAGAAFKPRMLRRLGALFVIGWLHMIFLITGDILTVYALVGLVLLAMRRVKDRTALLVAVGCYAYVFVTLGAAVLFVDSSAFIDPVAAVTAAQETTANLAGSFGDVIGEHLKALPLYGLSQLTVQGPTTLAALLLGMVAGRRRLLADLTGEEPLLRRVQLACFPIGLLGGVLYATAGGTGDTFATWVSVMTAPFLAAAYVATLLRVMHSERGTDLRRLLAPAGRMALSNYLGQSVATLLIFTGVGFGLVGQVSPLETVTFALGIFILQVGLSHWWMARYGYGPVEGVLRAVTNATPIRYSVPARPRAQQ
ncbi:DUF418 domain-containing protein [Kribbella sancticallisti]|uniref:DUF418 domain-containing protein n=1 Tax=Kribbella sancticallisti TaxID=460087 RepID=A0ABN2CTT0_9ACTN